MQVKLINEWSKAQAVSELQRCCGSRAWASAMAARRPFEDAAQLLKAAEDIWWNLSGDDWLEAFSHHPKIGNVDNLRKKFASTASWSEGEQKGVDQASEKALEQLAAGNNDYESRFGYIFIVCATGKSAEEMLAILQRRLHNKPAEELKVAAAEQSKITALRLEKLCQEVQSQPTS
ncbi:MAG TPA: 2-oxo-4-hydroxy-4-carboxy-5-ureidoimidazoline decarboxylase [Candidatus Obscuribacterales bacterium]